MKKYIIQYGSKKQWCVCGFSSYGQMVVLADNIKKAKKFTLKAAEAFIDKYSDCGYGFDSELVHIKEI